MPETCIKGSKLSHGGIVIEGSDTVYYNGAPVARIGDKASCSRHGSTVIIDAAQTTVAADGRLVAVDGAKCACGATVYGAGFNSTFVENL